MNFKKRNLLIVIFIIIIIINILIFLNNKQKTSLKYFIWNTQRVSLGKIINISFFSGFLISASLNNFLITKDIKNQTPNNLDEDFEKANNNNIKLDNEIPPERDIRDTQPTISVNYRVVKSTEDKDIEYDDDPYDKNKYSDDWTEKSYEW